jgi:tripeptide aminopeptidase
MEYSVKERFLKYVKIDTQADPMSNTYPTSLKQLDLTNIICEELNQMGVSYKKNDAGYIYAYLPSNVNHPTKKVFFCAHLDTAPDCSGTDVKPIVHSNYQGQDIILPDDPTQILSVKNHVELGSKIGHDVITASGKTLLGADDKAGVAIIMDALYQLVKNPTLLHGPVRALLTTDEEVGKGVANVDIGLVDADFGFTLDGGVLGSYEEENFSADALTVLIKGVSAHPGYAQKMENAIKIAGDFINALPKDHLCPEKTNKNDGFIHPTKISGQLEQAQVDFILRDFSTSKLDDFEKLIKDTIENVIKSYPNSAYQIERRKQYRNMKDVTSYHPYIEQIAYKAMQNIGIEPKMSKIRGGTDGAALSHMGLPCPNLFAGQHAIHGKQEWVTVQDMQKGVDTVLEICKLVAEI